MRFRIEYVIMLLLVINIIASSGAMLYVAPLSDKMGEVSSSLNEILEELSVTPTPTEPTEWEKTIVTGYSSEPWTLDPAAIHWALTMTHTRQMYEGLVTYEGSTGKAIPQLATSWETSSDGLTYTFHLRKGVKFHDGTPFNASAVKPSFERVVTIGGSAMAGIIKLIDKIETIDDYTVNLVLKEPYAPFLSSLASLQSTVIVSPSYIEAHATSEDPIAEVWMADHECGTGPYCLAGWVHEERILYEKFDDYWGGWDPIDGKYPHIERIMMFLVREPSTQKLKLEMDEISLMERFTGVYDLIMDMNKTEGLIATVFTRYGARMMAVMFNCYPGKPLNNVKLRQAIVHAIDLDEMNEVLHLGFCTRAFVVGPGMLGYEESLKFTQHQDIEKAKEILAEAGYPGGEGVPKLTIAIVAGNEIYRMEAEKMAADLNDIGIDLEIKIGTDVELAVLENDPETTPDLIKWNPTPAFGDNDYIFYNYWSTSAWYPGGANVGRYSNSTVDELLVEGRIITDQEKRKEIYVTVTELLSDDPPAIIQYWMPQNYVHWEYVKGHVHNPFYSRTMSFYDMYKDITLKP